MRANRAAGRADFARQVRTTKQQATEAGLLTAPLLDAAASCNNSGTADLLRQLAREGREHRVVMDEGAPANAEQGEDAR